MDTARYRWSFFIAHASADAEVAEALYERLAPHAATFLDKRDPGLLGADWDLALARAQREALISVVLVSASTEQAYYEREEIAAALALARSDGGARRVVPLYLDAAAATPGAVPYGLGLKGGLTLGPDFDLDDAAQALLALLQQLQQAPDAPPLVLPAPQGRSAQRRRTLLWTVAGTVAVGLGLAWWFASTPAPTPEPPLATDRAPGPAGAASSAAIAAATAPSTALSRRSCVELDYLSPSVIPHYLLNSVGTENFPYWLKVIATSRCETERVLKLKFERSDKVALVDPPQEFEFTVHRNRQVERTFEPRFDFTTQQPESLAIHWSIEDQRGTKISADSIGIELVPALTIAWDLRKPVVAGRHEPVEREYLLASLKAWTLKPPPRVAALGRSCREPAGGGTLLEREAAIRACYQRAFAGGGGQVAVSDSTMAFPAGPRQRIRAPLQLLTERQNAASALEAALLLATVVGVEHQVGIDPDLVLVVSPAAPGGPVERKSAWLAWREAGQPWRAVDLRLAGTQSFDANVATASARLQALFAGQPELAQAARGVGFSADGQVAVLNFGQVPRQYRISALP